jgi:hypothetical protein
MTIFSKIIDIIAKIFFSILLVVLSILSLVFIYIEGRLLFSGEWLIYDIPFLGMIRYIARLLIAISFIAYAVLQFVNFKLQSRFGIINSFCYRAYSGAVTI